jgi:outer membrane PBP1 activator LpoA protein
MRAILLPIAVFMIISGCETGNVRNTSDRDTPVDAQAMAFYVNKDFEQAATEFLRLAETDRRNADRHRISAAEAYIRINQIEKAGSVINSLVSINDNVDIQSLANLLLARIAISRNEPDQAAALLPPAPPENSGNNFVSTWYFTRSLLAEMQGRHTEAILNRVMLGNYLDEPALIEENTGKIWEHLESTEPGEFAGLASHSVNNLKPWIELAALKNSLQLTRTDLENAVNTWVAAYPDHPANPQITSRILADSESFHTSPMHIALLLPLSGVYERYSERIRDGFLAAWFEEQSYKPVVRIYNTDGSQITEVYNKAIEAGADFIVGPLEKDAVKALAALNPLPVRTLALNQIETGDTPETDEGTLSKLPELLQFGLPPEDEAQEVARRGIYEGYKRVLVINPADDFGNRVVNAFQDEWKRLGGRVLERISYDNYTDEFITPVKQLLNIDSSEARMALLKQRLGRNISVSSRLRNDADFIFMVGSSAIARQIVPHLRFFRADTIPIYTISSVYNGMPDPQSDIDLNGVEFVDMPWLFNTSENLRTRLMQDMESDNTALPRYFAFGIDAFRLIPRLGQMILDKNSRYPGETGQLYLTTRGIIHRNLIWARFIEGQPQAVNLGSQDIPQ